MKQLADILPSGRQHHQTDRCGGTNAPAHVGRFWHAADRLPGQGSRQTANFGSRAAVKQQIPATGQRSESKSRRQAPRTGGSVRPCGAGRRGAPGDRFSRVRRRRCSRGVSGTESAPSAPPCWTPKRARGAAGACGGVGRPTGLCGPARPLPHCMAVPAAPRTRCRRRLGLAGAAADLSMIGSR